MSNSKIVKGAVYIPARAFNTWQAWQEFNPTVAERDLQYAARLGLNALRVWFNYEFWIEAPGAASDAFDDFLRAANEVRIRPLVSLFEDCGVPYTPETARSKNPKEAFCLRSPGPDIIDDTTTWNSPRRYVEWFMDRYGNDARLLSIEVMNEPWWREENQRFALEMLRVAKDGKGTVDLSMGTLGRDVFHNLPYVDAGIDVFQFHLNFPESAEQFENALYEARLIEKLIGKPIWLTEWQRVRSKTGWKDEPVPIEERGPAYKILAEIISKHRIGSFFWSLMLRPAYLPQQRKWGTFNGLFHEDGSVWSIEDARALAGDPNFEAEERKKLPDWIPRPENMT